MLQGHDHVWDSRLYFVLSIHCVFWSVGSKRII